MEVEFTPWLVGESRFFPDHAIHFHVSESEGSVFSRSLVKVFAGVV